MHIGIDFDNTIVNHDAVFFKYALQNHLITPQIHGTKHHVGQAIQKLPDGNSKWTHLQGKVYGSYIGESKPMHGVTSFFGMCEQRSIGISIVSHRTQYPVLGPKVDLRKASLVWLANHKFFSHHGLFEDRVYFADTLDEKIHIINKLNVDFFIDDLDIVLTHKLFPPQSKKIYFNKHKRLDAPCIIHVKSWRAIGDFIFKDE